jgi:hypothetical protein
MNILKKSWYLFIIIMLTTLIACTGETTTEEELPYLFAGDVKIIKDIRRVKGFPNIPENYRYFDYRATAIELDQIVFSFAESKDIVFPNYMSNNQNSWHPIGFWDDARVGIPQSVTSIFYKDVSFGIPTYVGDRRSSSEGPYEGIATIPMVLGSSFVGLDKSRQSFGEHTYNFVDMIKSFYDVRTNLILNTTSNTVQGESVWYDLYPQISFTRLYDLYQEDLVMRQLVINGAKRWKEALPFMIDNEGNPNFEFMGFDVFFNIPISGKHIDPPIGGLIFLFYAAYELTNDPSYYDALIEVMDYVEKYQKNPNYEFLSDYIPLVAAILNHKYNTQYDVGKFLDFLFENDADFRQNWGMISGNYGGYPVHGLVGDQDYAFSANSFHLASTLAPLVKYDARYADAIGRYFINLVNNAKWFFPRQIPLNNQTMGNFLSFDPNGVLAYEGFRKSFNNVSPLAMGDATSMFSSPSDLSLYSSSHIGYLGAIVSETNVEGILKLDLNVTDSFGDRRFPTHLYHNPYSEKKVVRVNVGSGTYDLFDLVTKQVVARHVTGSINIDIEAESSRVLVTLPANTKFRLINNQIMVDDYILSKYQAAINITSPGYSRFTLRNQDVIRLNYHVPKGDEIELMLVYYNDILAYEGSFIAEVPYNKSILQNSDYTLRVIIYTKNGLRDISSTRVIAA